VAQTGSRVQSNITEENMAWLVEDDEDETQDIVILSSSPVIPKRTAYYDQSIEIGDKPLDSPKSRG
jgi:hypothetical protein